MEKIWLSSSFFGFFFKKNSLAPGLSPVSNWETRRGQSWLAPLISSFLSDFLPVYVSGFVIAFVCAFSDLSLAETSTFTKQAQSYFSRSEFDKASSLLWQNIEKLDRDGVVLLIKIHEKKQEWDLVLKASQVLLSKNQKDKEAYFYQGRAYLAQRKENQKAINKEKENLAAEVLKKAIEIDPKYQIAYEEFAKIYDVKKGTNFYELRLWYQGMIEKLGEKPDFLAKMCEIDALDGINASAIKNCEHAIKLNPANAKNYVHLGRTQKNSGEAALARKTLKSAADKFLQSAEAQEAYGKVLEEDKNYLEAFHYFENCYLADKKNETCLVGAANAGAQIQKFEKSVFYLKLACAINRAHSVDARKIAAQLKQAQLQDWKTKFEQAAEACTGH